MRMVSHVAWQGVKMEQVIGRIIIMNVFKTQCSQFPDQTWYYGESHRTAQISGMNQLFPDKNFAICAMFVYIF